MNANELITAIVPTSPLWLHPSTEIIDETYSQFWKHLPEAKFIVLADGVHPEEEYMRERYIAYLDNLLNRSYEWSRVRVISFGKWWHQSGMLKQILDEGIHVQTPLVFWSEHDIPLSNDRIDWQGIVETLMEGKIGGIRFELTGDPLKQNEVKGFVMTHGIPIVLSTQFVNWPQVFRVDYLKEFISRFGDAKTYLECAERDGIVGELWNKWQYGIYSPEGEIRRCYHTNGRERRAPGLGKPYIEVDGKQRHIYGSYTPYKETP
jgi:hypothetical protein